MVNITTAIKREKAKLIKKAEKSGIYENFGQKEVYKLTDKYIDISDYTKEMNHRRDLITRFDNWGATFCG